MRREWLGVTLALLGSGAALVAACGGGSTYTLVRDGNHAYTRGDAAKALNDYRQAQVQQPGLPLLNYDAGNALYQQGDYTRGVTESLLATQNGDDPLRAQAFYTIGADDYRQGKLQDALNAFKSALRIDPSDTDAKYNVELIQRQLDREAQARAGLPTPTPEPTQPPGQPGQQGQQPQQGQSSNGGAQNPSSAGQSSASGPPSNGQPNGGAAQQGQQSGQSGQQAGGSPQSQSGSGQQGSQPSGTQSGQGFGGSAGANGPGTTGTPAPTVRQQQQQAAQALQQAISSYQQTGSVDDALGILDALAQQQAIQQQAQANQSDPHSLDK